MIAITTISSISVNPARLAHWRVQLCRSRQRRVQTGFCITVLLLFRGNSLSRRPPLAGSQPLHHKLRAVLQCGKSACSGTQRSRERQFFRHDRRKNSRCAAAPAGADAAFGVTHDPRGRKIVTSVQHAQIVIFGLSHKADSQFHFPFSCRGSSRFCAGVTTRGNLASRGGSACPRRIRG